MRSSEIASSYPAISHWKQLMKSPEHNISLSVPKSAPRCAVECFLGFEHGEEQLGHTQSFNRWSLSITASDNINYHRDVESKRSVCMFFAP